MALEAGNPLNAEILLQGAFLHDLLSDPYTIKKKNIGPEFAPIRAYKHELANLAKLVFELGRESVNLIRFHQNSMTREGFVSFSDKFKNYQFQHFKQLNKQYANPEVALIHKSAEDLRLQILSTFRGFEHFLKPLIENADLRSKNIKASTQIKKLIDLWFEEIDYVVKNKPIPDKLAYATGLAIIEAILEKEKRFMLKHNGKTLKAINCSLDQFCDKFEPDERSLILGPILGNTKEGFTWYATKPAHPARQEHLNTGLALLRQLMPELRLHIEQPV